MAIPCRTPFEINEDVIDVLLVLEVLLAQYRKVEDLLCYAAFWSEACLFLSDDLFRLRFQSVQQEFQHNFTLVADEADGTIVLA